MRLASFERCAKADVCRMFLVLMLHTDIHLCHFSVAEGKSVHFCSTSVMFALCLKGSYVMDKQ